MQLVKIYPKKDKKMEVIGVLNFEQLNLVGKKYKRIRWDSKSA